MKRRILTREPPFSKMEKRRLVSELGAARALDESIGEKRKKKKNKEWEGRRKSPHRFPVSRAWRGVCRPRGQPRGRHRAPIDKRQAEAPAAGNVQASTHFPRPGPNRPVCRLSPRWYRPTEEDPLRDMLVSLPLRSSGRPPPHLFSVPAALSTFSAPTTTIRRRIWHSSCVRMRWIVRRPDRYHRSGRATSWKCSGTRCAPEWLLVPFSRFDTVNYSPASKLRYIPVEKTRKDTFGFFSEVSSGLSSVRGIAGWENSCLLWSNAIVGGSCLISARTWA